MTDLPFGVLDLKPFKPTVFEHREMRITSYIHEDVTYVARPMTKLHGVDALLASDDHRLVGVNFWRLLDDTNPVELQEWPDSEPSPSDADKLLGVVSSAIMAEVREQVCNPNTPDPYSLEAGGAVLAVDGRIDTRAIARAAIAAYEASKVR